MTALLLDRVRVAVARRLDEQLARYREASRGAPPPGEVLAAFDRLKDSAPMRRVFGQLTKRGAGGGFWHPVIYGEVRDDKRREWYIAQFDRQDEEFKRRGWEPQSEEERCRALEPDSEW